jgi:HeH/LEM domain
MDVIVTGKRCVIYAGDSYFNGDVIADIKEKEAARLLKKGHVRMTVDDAVIAETPPIDDMRVAELKDLLDKLEVDYPSDALKADLVDLVKTHTAEPPEE